MFNQNQSVPNIFQTSQQTKQQSLFANNDPSIMQMNSNRLGSGQKNTFSIGVSSNHKSNNHTSAGLFGNTNTSMFSLQGENSGQNKQSKQSNSITQTNGMSQNINPNLPSGSLFEHAFGISGGSKPSNLGPGNLLSTPVKNNNDKNNFLAQNPSNMAFAPASNSNNNPSNGKSLTVNTNIPPSNATITMPCKGTFDWKFQPFTFEESTDGKNVSFHGMVVTFNPQYSSKSLEEVRNDDCQLRKSGAVPNKETAASISGGFSSVFGQGQGTVSIFSQNPQMEKGGGINSGVTNSNSNSNSGNPNVNANVNEKKSNPISLSLFNMNTSANTGSNKISNSTKPTNIFSNTLSTTALNTTNKSDPPAQPSNDPKPTLNPNPTTTTTGPNTIVPAPSNILGVDISSLSSNVQNAVVNCQKLKDFIREFEEDLEGSEAMKSGYNKSKSYISKYRHTISGPHLIEDYYRKYDYAPRYSLTSKDRLSDYDYYFSLKYPQSNLNFNFREDKYKNVQYLQHKRSLPFEQSCTYSSASDSVFNGNLIQMNKRSSLFEYEKYRKRQDNGDDFVTRYSRHYSGTSAYATDAEEFSTYDENRDFNLDHWRSSISSTILPLSSAPEKIVQVVIEVKQENFIFSFSINKNNTVKLLKELLVEKLKAKDKFKFRNISTDNITIIKSNSLMKDSKLIGDYDVKSGDKLIVTLMIEEDLGRDEVEDENNKSSNKVKPKNLHLNKSNSLNNLSLNESTNYSQILKRRRKVNEIAPIELLPTLTKPGYATLPEFKQICRMTLEELKNVKNFEISNEFGKIHWNDNVDLQELNLDDIVEIQNSFVSLYRGTIPSPPKGKGLNKPFEITLKVIPDVDMSDSQEKEDFIESLQDYVANLGGKFMDFDEDKNELTFFCKEIK